MNKSTKLSIHDKFPLTCSRSGTCCHGKLVLLNPWELACIAKAKKVTTKKFAEKNCNWGGIQLRFDGKYLWRKQPSCSQYIENIGCSVYLGRPLSCRLYPLGRQIQSKEVHYIFQGSEFPCLNGCPEVAKLPQLSVGKYLEEQAASKFEKAQDEYLGLMQDIADMAFVFLLETGLAQSGDTKTLLLWKTMGNETPEALSKRIGNEWMNCLMLPKINDDVEDPILFVEKHKEILQLNIHEKYGNTQSNIEFHEASVLIMGLALQLARSIGANPITLGEHWIDAAIKHGAKI